MKVIIKNKIEIHDAPLRVRRVVKNTLTLPNPMYFKMMRMGKTQALYACPKDFKYYNEDVQNNVLYVGRGVEGKLINYLVKNEIPFELQEETTDKKLRKNCKTGIKLRTYQVGDIDIITDKPRGIIRLGTGYGKTIIAVKLIESYQVPTLIIVPRTHLVTQFRNTIKETTGITSGIIQGKTEDIKEITVASIQTLVSRPETAIKIAKKFSMLIVDECHTFITKKRLDIIQIFNTKYLYGMTATPRRTDQQDKAILFTFGTRVIDKDIERAKPEVKLIESDAIIPVEEYADMITTQIENVGRNDLIIKHTIKESEKGRKILILTKRIKHYSILRDMLEMRCPKLVIYSINSKDNAKDRSNLLQNLREGNQDFDIIFGTYSMLATGTDIPALDTLIFAGDLRSDVLQEQSAGRILRLFGNKLSPKIIDIVDNRNGILANQARSRKKFYKLMEWI